jgi:hypothetical protein
VEFIASLFASLSLLENFLKSNVAKEMQPLPRVIHRDCTLAGGSKHLGEFSMGRFALPFSATHFLCPHEMNSFCLHQPTSNSYVCISDLLLHSTSPTTSWFHTAMLLLIDSLGSNWVGLDRDSLSLVCLVMAEVLTGGGGSQMSSLT